MVNLSKLKRRRLLKELVKVGQVGFFEARSRTLQYVYTSNTIALRTYLWARAVVQLNLWNMKYAKWKLICFTSGRYRGNTRYFRGSRLTIINYIRDGSWHDFNMV